MEKYLKQLAKSEKIFVGLDLHKKNWYITVRTRDIELFSSNIEANWEALKKQLDKFNGHEISVVYEAGYFGYWLHDEIVSNGWQCRVTPPSLIPEAQGNRVKTDRRDARKLAHLLANGMLKSIWTPKPEDLYHRDLMRRRRQFVGDRVRTQNRIKALLQFYGIPMPVEMKSWSKQYVERLSQLTFKDNWMAKSYGELFDLYTYLSERITEQTRLIKELAEIEKYREKVKILRSVPGIGLIVAMEMLVELGDVTRFKRADQIGAYLGLTPAQYTSSDKVRMGRITGVGKNSLRASLIEASWQLVKKDPAIKKKFDDLRYRTGSKRAIVAIARHLVIRARRILMDGQPYKLGLAA